MTPAKIDSAILSVVSQNWQKVAMIIVKTADKVDVAFRESEGCYEVIAARLYALAEVGKLDSQGNVRNWRFSEVKLPPQS